MLRYKIFLLPFLFLVSTNSKSQDTLIIKGKVLSIDTIRFYVVLKIKSCDTCSTKIVLSPRDSQKTTIKTNCKKICIGNSYSFNLLGVVIIKGENGNNIFLNFRKFKYGNAFSLDNGEFPYLALNMIDAMIDCEQ